MINYSEKLVGLCNSKDPKRVSKGCFGVPKVYVPEGTQVKEASASFEEILHTTIASKVASGEKLDVYVDCDDVLADLFHPMLSVLNKAFGKNILPEEINTWDRLSEIFSLSAVTKAFELLVPELKEKDDAFMALNNLYSKSYLNVNILTALTGEKQMARIQWVKDNLPWFPVENLIFDRDKSKYSGGLIIDDAVHNIDSYDGLRILITMPHNQAYTVSDARIKRLQSLADVLILMP